MQLWSFFKATNIAASDFILPCQINKGWASKCIYVFHDQICRISESLILLSKFSPKSRCK